MIAPEIRTANEIIAKFIGFEQSEIEPDYWYCKEYGISLLKFHENWEWLMYAITKIQVSYKYKLQVVPYDTYTESILLSQYLNKIESKIKVERLYYEEKGITFRSNKK